MISINPALDVFICLGLGLVAIVGGGLGLLRKRRIIRQGWVLPAALAVLTGVPALALALTGQTTYTTVALLALAGFWLAVFLFRAPLLHALVRHLTRIMHGTVIPSLILTSVGAAVIGWQVHALDSKLNQEMQESEADLQSMLAIDLQPNPGFVKMTDRGRHIPLYEAASDEVVPAIQEATYIRSMRLDNHLIQTGKSDPHYNCHGWVFAAAKGWVRGQFVDQILQDNDYAPVSQPIPGDLAVFRNGSGEVAHSALVRTVLDNGQILLESKWGRIGRYLHSPDEHAYQAMKRTYYHTTRGSHELHDAPAQSVSPGS